MGRILADERVEATTPDDYVPDCDDCGEPIDYCHGHGERVSFVVWQHHGKPWPRAVGHFAERELADAYAAYLNRTLGLSQWSEVRRYRPAM